jgi:hypothetical protein
MEEIAMRITLEPWEYRRACDVGIGRCVENWGKPDAEHYGDRSRMEDDRTAHVAAAICELAVAKMLNRYWHGHVWKKGVKGPDVGASIEVRRVKTGNGVAVRRTDAGRFVIAARAIAPEFTEVEVLGYVKADDALMECPDGESWFYWPISRLNGLQGSPLCQGKTSPLQAPSHGGAGSILNAV